MPMLAETRTSPPPSIDGLLQLVLNAPRQVLNVLHAAGLVQHQRKLVPAKARHRVLRPQTGAQTSGSRQQKRVPRRMAPGVVDLLEAVEIEEDHGKVAVRPAPQPRHGQRQPIEEQHPVRQSCQRVVQRRMLQPGLRLLLLAYVAIGRRVAAPAGPKLHRHDDDGHIQRFARAGMPHCLDRRPALRLNHVLHHLGLVHLAFGNNQIEQIASQAGLFRDIRRCAKTHDWRAGCGRPA